MNLLVLSAPWVNDQDSYQVQVWHSSGIWYPAMTIQVANADLDWT